jgi:hypothetical protein
MKIIAFSILAFAILVASVAGTARALTIQPRPAITGEPCIGINCWPPSAPMRHRPVRHALPSPVGEEGSAH